MQPNVVAHRTRIKHVFDPRVDSVAAVAAARAGGESGAADLSVGRSILRLRIDHMFGRGFRIEQMIDIVSNIGANNNGAPPE